MSAKSPKSPHFLGCLGDCHSFFSPSKHQTDCSNLCLCISTTDLATVSEGVQERKNHDLLRLKCSLRGSFSRWCDSLQTQKSREHFVVQCRTARLHIGGDFTYFYLRNGHLGEVRFLQITKVFFNMLIYNRLKMKK